MDRIFIGRYPFGTRVVEIFGLPDDQGGAFNTAPDMGICEIVIGLDYGCWEKVLAVLSHEIHELAAVEINVRWVPECDYCNGSDKYLFVMTHYQFSEVVARAAWLVADCYEDVKAAYDLCREAGAAE
jgi:hypothetical protein